MNLPFIHIKTEENVFHYRVIFDHPVFDAHFPGHPVLPGAILISMAKEAASKWLNREIKIISAGDIRFLKPIQPDKNHPELKITIRQAGENTNRLDINIISENEVCFRMKCNIESIHRFE